MSPIALKNNKKHIYVVWNTQPILDITIDERSKKPFGLNRDRCPDRDWPELRNSLIELDDPNLKVKMVPLTKKMKVILLEDLAYVFGYNSEIFNKKLVEFKLI